MDEDIDTERIKQIKYNDTTTLTKAKLYWTQKFRERYNDPIIVLAPHTLRFAECCSLAVSRTCVIIGRAENVKPRGPRSHTILDLEDHPEHLQTLSLIRQLLKNLKCRMTYRFHIENPLGPDHKISYATVLIAVWKFVAHFQPELNDDEVATSMIDQVLNDSEVKIPQSDVAAVIHGSRTSAYLSGFCDDIFFYANGQTELESVDVRKFSNRYDILFVGTDLGRLERSLDKYFVTSFIEEIKYGFESIEEIEPEDGFREYTSIETVLLNLSRTRIERAAFCGTEYEKNCQRILEKFCKRISPEDDPETPPPVNPETPPPEPFSKGGIVFPTGIALIVKKDVFGKNEFFNKLVEAFNVFFRIPSCVQVERLRETDGVHVLSASEIDSPAGSQATIHLVSEVDQAGLHASNDDDADASMDDPEGGVEIVMDDEIVMDEIVMDEIVMDDEIEQVRHYMPYPMNVELGYGEKENDSQLQ